MGPETHVDLVCSIQLMDAARNPVKKRAKLRGLCLCKLGDRDAVAERLHEQSPDAQRTDAVLDDPVGCREEAATREWTPPCNQLTSKTSDIHRFLSPAG